MIAPSQGWSVSARRSRAFLRPKRPLSMVWAITLPFVCLMLLSVMGIGNLMRIQNEQATQQLAMQIEQEVGDRVQVQLTDWLKKPVMVNQLNHSAFSQADASLANPGELERRFAAQLQTFEELHQVMVADAQGRSLTLVQSPETTPEEYRVQRGDGTTSDWYQEVIAKGQKTWVKQFEQGLAIAAQPILNSQNQIEQVVATAIDLAQMDELLNAIRLPGKAQVFVLDRDGLLLSSSTEEVPFDLEQGEMVGMQARDSQNPLTQATTAYLQRRWDEIPVDGETRLFEEKSGGEHLIIQARRYQPYGGADWVLGTIISRSDLLGAVRSQQYQTLLLCTLLLLLSLLLCVGIARYLVRPVRALSQAAQSITQGLRQGRWSTALPVHRRDELGDLARSFSQMSLALQQSFEQLHHQNQQLGERNQRLTKQQTRLEELTRLKDEFLANTSHELRTPLSGILGLAESLQAQTVDPLMPQQLDVIDLIIMSAQRLTVLVNDILDLSKLENHALQLKPSAVNLHAIAQHVLAICRPLAEPRQLQLINQIPADLPAIYADSHRLQQVFYNLVGNAIKFTHEGSVTLSAEPVPQQDIFEDLLLPGQSVPTATRGKQYMAICITDTGIGISPEVQRRMFNAFEQGQGETTRLYGGTGLGLTVAKSLVELHGGWIEVRSQHGQGSQFRFTLPILSDQWIASPPSQSFPLQSDPLQTDPLQTPQSQGPQSQSSTQKLSHEPQKTTTLLATAVTMSSTQAPTFAASPASPIQGLPVLTPTPQSASGLPSLFTSPNQAGLTQANSRDIATHPPEKSVAKKARILVVDDDLTNLQVLSGQLANEPYEVVQATNGEQALILLSSCKLSEEDHGQYSNQEGFDLVILDVMMPLMSGYEVCEKLRVLYPSYQLPVIMLTAKVQTEDVVQGFRAGANDYLKKPFSRDELLSRMEVHLSNRLYGRFVPEHFLRFLHKSTITDIHLGNQVSCDMTVLFSDIRGFATLSETMTPQENFDFINDYLQRVSPEIRGHEGFIVKYLGDGMMAIFPERPEHAIAAGIAKLHQVEQLNRDRHPRPPIHIGIGIHHGPMMVGIVGEAQRMQGDAFSDGVNLTARLEGLTKFYGVSMIISEEVRSQLDDATSFLMRRLDQVTVKGRAQPLTIYEVFDGDEASLRNGKAQTRLSFELGLDHYQAGRFGEAQQAFEQVLTRHPEDPTAQLYSRWVSERLASPPPENWAGVSDWSQK